MDQSFTREQQRDYYRARVWAQEHLLPWATTENFAGWYAAHGRECFTELDAAYEWWSDLPEAQAFGEDDS